MLLRLTEIRLFINDLTIIRKSPDSSIKKLIVIVLSLACCACAGTGKTRRIALEELDITLFDNGSVVSSLRVSEGEAKGIVESIKLDVLESFEADSFKVIMEKGIVPEFDKLVSGKLMLERIVPPLLRFYDADGKIIREMLMKRPGNSKKSAMGKFESIGTAVNRNRTISRDAVVSADGKSAIVTEYFAEFAELDSWKYVSNTSSNIQLYDVSGQMLWEEMAPEHMYVNKMVISEAGEVIAFILVRERGEMEKHFSANRLLVFDRGKRILLDFTGEGNLYSVRSTSLAISPSGRYLSLAAMKRGGERTTLFFDIKRDSFMEWPQVLPPLRLGDDGNVFMIDRFGHSVKLLNLTEKLVNHY